MKKCLLIFLFCLPMIGQADTVQPTLDPALQERFKNLTSELRCLKCQNQTIYDSQAGLADDLKRQITDQMNEGRSDQEIVQYLVARYGDFVRYKPDINAATIMLWAGPFLFFVIGIVMLVNQLKKRQRLISDAPLSEEESRRVQSLINSDSGDNSR